MSSGTKNKPSESDCPQSTTPEANGGSVEPREPDFSIQDDPVLVAEGWQRRHLVGPDRAEESIELYTSMGFEVTAKKLTPDDFGARCKDCASIICSSYVMIYTRKKTPC